MLQSKSTTLTAGILSYMYKTIVYREKNDDGFVRSVSRIIDVWNDRRVFDSDTIEKFRSIIG